LVAIKKIPGNDGITELNKKMISDVATAISGDIPIMGSKRIEIISLNPNPLNVIGTMSAEIISGMINAIAKNETSTSVKNCKSIKYCIRVNGINNNCAVIKIGIPL
jgi:hypothetical protein